MPKLKWIILIQLCVILLKPLPNVASQKKLTAPTIQGKDLNLNIIYDNNPYAELDECVITPSSLGKKSVAYGAAGMILEHIFRHPKIPKRDIRNLITNQD